MGGSLSPINELKKKKNPKELSVKLKKYPAKNQDPAERQYKGIIKPSFTEAFRSPNVPQQTWEDH